MGNKLVKRKHNIIKREQKNSPAYLAACYCSRPTSCAAHPSPTATHHPPLARRTRGVCSMRATTRRATSCFPPPPRRRFGRHAVPCFPSTSPLHAALSSPPMFSSPRGAHRHPSSLPWPPCPRRLTSVPIGSASSPHVDKPTATTSGAPHRRHLRHLQALALMTATVDLLAPAPPRPRHASPPNRGEPLIHSPLLPMLFAHSSHCFRQTRECTATAKLAAFTTTAHPQ